MDADRFQQIEVSHAADLWAWLGQHHAQADSVWLVTWKAQHISRYIPRDAVLDALIAHGWIDGRRMKLDEDRTMQLISPRKQKLWAESYKKRAARLEAEGRMHPAGRMAVQQGRAGGTWDVQDAVDALTDPDDLLASLQAQGAQGGWQAAAPSYRRNILRWIASAKRPETRQKRIAAIVDASKHGRRVPQF